MKTVRQKWLQSFWGYIGFSLLYFLISSFFKLEDIFQQSIFLVYLPIQMCFIYHCAYKKKGTAWLMYVIIGIPFIYLWRFTIDISRLFETKIEETEQLEHVFFITLFINIAISFWYWNNCRLLRKENLEIIKSALPTPSPK